MAQIPNYKTLVKDIIWKSERETIDLTDDGLEKIKEKMIKKLIIWNSVLIAVLIVVLILMYIGYSIPEDMDDYIGGVIASYVVIILVWIFMCVMLSKQEYSFYGDYIKYRNVLIKEQEFEENSDDISQYPHFHAMTSQFYLHKNFSFIRENDKFGKGPLNHPIKCDLLMYPLTELFAITIKKNIFLEYSIHLYFSKEKQFHVSMEGEKKEFVIDFLEKLDTVRKEPVVFKLPKKWKKKDKERENKID